MSPQNNHSPGQSDQTLRMILDSIPAMIWYKDTKNNILKVNRSAAALEGVTPDQMQGKSCDALYPPKQSQDFFKDDLEVIRSAKPKLGIIEPHTAVGSKETFWFEVSKVPVFDDQGDVTGVIAFAVDVTQRIRAEQERRRMEQHIQKAQKLESLGVLAGGLAHDFNNLLSGIYGFIGIALNESPSPSVKEHLATSLKTIDRARDLTRQLLTFAKGGEPQRRTRHLFPFVEQVTRFALSGSSVTVSFDIEENLYPCCFDENQIGQVLDNVIINAVQAIQTEGAIRVAARNRTLGENQIPSLAPGNYVLLTISDNGPGISKDDLGRVFDPFYSTKEAGSGLGLATSYSIVSRHGGWIDMASNVGEGTTVSIYIPASKEEAKAESSKLPSVGHTGTGRVLVMDDEAIVQKAYHLMLTGLGYEVVCTSEGAEALTLFQKELEAGRAFAAAILDLTVPGGLGGKEIVEAMRKAAPELPLFVSSGYANSAVMASPREYGFTASFNKPFTPEELIDVFERYVSGRGDKLIS